MTRVVLDCSVAMAWCFDDEADAMADALLSSLAEREAIVPAIWPLEIANVLALAEKKGRITNAGSAKFIGTLQSLPIQVDEQTAERALGEILSLARSFQITAYDAAYLELALREGGSIATLDARLRTAAQSAGVQLFQTRS
jgi:predicted nucleic acid-binding protein